MKQYIHLRNTENAREPAILLSIFTGIEMLKRDHPFTPGSSVQTNFPYWK